MSNDPWSKANGSNGHSTDDPLFNADPWAAGAGAGSASGASRGPKGSEDNWSQAWSNGNGRAQQSRTEEKSCTQGREDMQYGARDPIFENDPWAQEQRKPLQPWQPPKEPESQENFLQAALGPLDFPQEKHDSDQFKDQFKVETHPRAHQYAFQLGQQLQKRYMEFSPSEMATFVSALSRLVQKPSDEELICEVVTTYSEYAAALLPPEELKTWTAFLQEASQLPQQLPQEPHVCHVLHNLHEEYFIGDELGELDLADWYNEQSESADELQKLVETSAEREKDLHKRLERVRLLETQSYEANRERERDLDEREAELRQREEAMVEREQELEEAKRFLRFFQLTVMDLLENLAPGGLSI